MSVSNCPAICCTTTVWKFHVYFDVHVHVVRTIFASSPYQIYTDYVLTDAVYYVLCLHNGTII